MEKNVLLISSDQFGSGSEELGKILMKSYVSTLVENNRYQHIIFVNAGVKLVCDESNTVEDFKEIAKQSELLICTTCLNYYELEEKVAVGNTSNMKIIAQVISEATKVVNL